ncbi:MAG: DUF6797 domain-containing protein [Planctomycetaceae bacterium]
MRLLPFFAAVCLLFPNSASCQLLEQQLISTPPGDLIRDARSVGDARRGAILFHQVHVGCVKCHAVDGSSNSLGPDLTRLKEQKTATDEFVVTSVLKPSAEIRKGFESVTVVTKDGLNRTGLLVSRDDSGVVLRDPARNGERVAIEQAAIDEVVDSRLSIMPVGLANQLANRQQFLDLLRYVLEIRDGGLPAARKLQPPPGMLTLQLPEYEQHVDHAGLISKLNDDAFDRGEAIYNRLCINCHGTREAPGSLPTALRFADGKFRSGSDPYTLYRTLTHGFGLMVPQTWMVPQQKYDVIHYIRESYIREANPTQYHNITDDYLAGLPQGDTFGPDPIEYAPWSDMNYGPSMINTFEIGSDGSNFAYKGIAVRLDAGPGGISRGSSWAVFDHDTLRFAAGWMRRPKSKETGFINWQGIHFDGRHGTHPRVVGDVQVSNPTGPGWANPETGSFEDDQRVIGRDDRRYGPLPGSWAKYRGLHTVGDQTVVEYTVDTTTVLERFGQSNVSMGDEEIAVMSRTMQLNSREKPLQALVATHPADAVILAPLSATSVVLRTDGSRAKPVLPSVFDGASHLQTMDGSAFDMTTSDFSIMARIRTTDGGTIFSQTKAEGPWVPNGKTFFVRGGKLCYDIGWVGVVQSKRSVDDGKWHDVALTWNQKSAAVRFYIDGRPSGGGQLRPKDGLGDSVVRIGFSAGNFPSPSYFTGEISSVAFYRRELSEDEVKGDNKSASDLPDAAASWDLNAEPNGETVSDRSSGGHHVSVIRGSGSGRGTTLLAGIVGDTDGFEFEQRDQRLCLNVPVGKDVRHVAVWTARPAGDSTDQQLRKLIPAIEDRVSVDRLSERLQLPSPARWPEVIATQPTIGSDDGAFAVDVLATPVANPWLARLRLTGHDFLADGDRVAVCTWDGDVWMVTGLKSLNLHSALISAPKPATENVRPELKWQRIATGLFQPLGVKVVADDVYVTCRDQLVILRDRNGDGETDFYECFNNDHQVTEHFHEFAMGLQQDEIGNFYYAKSARHALKAIVPHHGTLLKVPSDGSRTEIVANGFRAANGVCLNPDGSFIVTDQEGHWNPKNRINWVREGGFYGNMFGYHDVTDESDSAMEQPLCWITNAFDRSPAELLWIDSDAWGPLNGTLLNLSYGYGKVYVVPHENKGGQMQGGMCELPIPQFPTGIARGRISPHDHGLYLCGMFAWGSSQQAQEGGFYRLRPTGRPSNLPVGLHAVGKQLKITFTDPLDAASAKAVDSYTVKVWSLQRSANYGSKHYDERELAVSSTELSADRKTITLTLPDLAPTWCMEIACRLKSVDGDNFERIIHNTIHRLD